VLKPIFRKYVSLERIKNALLSMPQTILIASTNRHKVEEIKKIFRIPGMNFISLEHYIEIPEAIEDGKTFQDNAILKAKHYYHHTKMPVIADDSGLVVPALNGEPGIHSARYAGEQSAYDKNNALLLSRMKDLAEDERFAFFICVVVFFDGNNVIFSEGRAEGKIINELKGTGGFGYDPLFYYPGAQKTFAEMGSEEKNQVSHRYRALKSLNEKLQNSFG
jgi:XTP/dITP diphosphohydrolase